VALDSYIRREIPEAERTAGGAHPMSDNYLDLLDDHMARIEALKHTPVDERQRAVQRIVADMSPQQRAAFTRLLQERRVEHDPDRDLLAYMRWEDEY
jgi:hypothetical protein